MIYIIHSRGSCEDYSNIPLETLGIKQVPLIISSFFLMFYLFSGYFIFFILGPYHLFILLRLRLRLRVLVLSYLLWYIDQSNHQEELILMPTRDLNKFLKVSFQYNTCASNHFKEIEQWFRFWWEVILQKFSVVTNACLNFTRMITNKERYMIWGLNIWVWDCKFKI